MFVLDQGRRALRAELSELQVSGCDCGSQVWEPYTPSLTERILSLVSAGCSNNVYTERTLIPLPAHWPVTAGFQQDTQMGALSPSQCHLCAPMARVLLLPECPRSDATLYGPCCVFCAPVSASAHVRGSLARYSGIFISVLVIRSTVFTSPPRFFLFF